LKELPLRSIPITVGDGADPYNGYNSSVDPTVSVEFSTGAFRYGHSEVSQYIWRVDGTGETIPEGNLELRNSYFNSTYTVGQVGIESILLGMAGYVQNAVDIYFIDDLRNYLFGKPGLGGLDLAAVNIQRGRDHGLQAYNDYRVLFGLPRYTSWSQINPDPNVYNRLSAAYASIDDCDVYTCGLAEYHNYSNVGDVFAMVINAEYDKFRDGDRFWYQNGQWNTTEYQEIFSTQLSDVIARNTQIQPEELQCFVMAAADGCGKPVVPPPPTGLFPRIDFNITIRKKTTAHPYFGQGSAYGFVVNGVEGANINVVRGNAYYFGIQSSCAHSFILVNMPEPGQNTPGGYIPYTPTAGDDDDDDGALNSVLYQFGCVDGNREMAIVIVGDAPNYLYYQCDFHSLMGGLLVVTDSPKIGASSFLTATPLVLIIALLLLLL